MHPLLTSLFLALFAASPCLGQSHQPITVEWLSGNAAKGRARINAPAEGGKVVEADIVDGHVHGAFKITDRGGTVVGVAEHGRMVRGRYDFNQLVYANGLSGTVEPRSNRESYQLVSKYTQEGTTYDQKKVWTCDEQGDVRELWPHGIAKRSFTCRSGVVDGAYREFDPFGFAKDQLTLKAGWLHGRQYVAKAVFRGREVDYAEGDQTTPVYDHFAKTQEWEPIDSWNLFGRFEEESRTPFLKRIGRVVGGIADDAGRFKHWIPEVGFDDMRQASFQLGLAGVGQGGHIGCVACAFASVRGGILIATGGGDRFGAMVDYGLGVTPIPTLRLGIGGRFDQELGVGIQPGLDFGVGPVTLQCRWPYYPDAARMRAETGLSVWLAF